MPGRMGRWWIGPAVLLVVVAGVGVVWLRTPRSSPRREPAPSAAPKISRASREEYLKDPARVNREIRLKPVQGNKPDSIDDLRIDFVDESSPMFAAGFRKGDRVLKVNGSPVTTLSRAVNLVHEIGKSTVLTVDVDRDGKLLAFRFEFEQDR
jgi:type II secretory pathway component PulC